MRGEKVEDLVEIVKLGVMTSPSLMVGRQTFDLRPGSQNPEHRKLLSWLVEASTPVPSFAFAGCGPLWAKKDMACLATDQRDAESKNSPRLYALLRIPCSGAGKPTPVGSRFAVLAR